MPFLAKEHLDIPTKDIISWCYDNRGTFAQDKPIYVDCNNPSNSISANQAYALIRKLVAGFHAAGLQREDVVCIHAFNSVLSVYPNYGIVGAGGVFIGTNPAYTAFELEHALKVSKAKFLISEPEILQAPLDTAINLGIQKTNVLLLAESDQVGDHGYSSWRTLLDHGSKDWIRFDDLETAKNTNAFLMMSSGTTGLPKAAQISHYNLVAESTLVHENPQHLEPYHMSRIVCLPMFHAAIAPYCHTTTLRSGRESYIMRRFAMPDFLTNMLRFSITSMILVPPMIVAMLNAAKRDHEAEAWVRRCLSTVQAVVAGAAPLDVSTQVAFQALLPTGSTCTQLLGMTETSCVVTCFYHPENDSTGSVGRLLPNIDAKIVNADFDGDDAPEVGPYDVRGELCFRGPTIIRGYLDNQEANRRDWDSEGYFHGGDIVYCDSKTGLFYVVDRKKELIKVRGFQVAPNEIEGVLLSHPEVIDAAVIGVQISQDVEVPRAYVIKTSGSGLQEANLMGLVAAKLAKYKQLEGGVRFVESIPKTASGKILKRILREEARRETSAKL